MPVAKKNVQIRYNNSDGITYVLKTNKKTQRGVINTFVKGRGGCYSQTGSNKLNCRKNNSFFIFV